MIFIVNSGSSSLKFRVYDTQLRERANGLMERIGLDRPFLKFANGGPERKIEYPDGVPDHKAALARVFEELAKLGEGKDIRPEDVKAFGHRVVHGGEEFVKPTVVTPALLARLKEYSKLAPLHNPPNLAGIESCMALAPHAKQVAVFDTAFYKTIPPEAFMYALPYEFYEKHRIRKYGFHGISHRYVTEQAALVLKKPLAKLRLVSCHLGSGSSVTAVKNGKAYDTTMGFTPLEGLTMSTRCGDIDPAIPIYMIRTLGLTADRVDEIMNKESGLLGISGYKDLRDVMTAAGHKIPGYELAVPASAEQKRRARLAIDMFCYDVARYVGQFAALMGGCDAVIFTAGVGERSAVIRERVMKMVKLPGRARLLVMPTDEELMIARETKKAAR